MSAAQRVTSRETSGEAAALRRLASAWTRVGAYLSTPPAAGPVDLESLLVATARIAPDDERLFVVAASWLAAHHGFVNGRRLAVLAARLARSTEPAAAEASAALGALLSWADELSGAQAESLRAAVARCRPVRPARPFFRVVRALPSVAALVRRDAHQRFAAWGLWYDGDAAKPEAVRPVAWIVAHTPELRIRALVGPTLEADLLAAALLGLPDPLPGDGRPAAAATTGHGDKGRDTPGLDVAPDVAVRDVSRALRVSYAAAHEGADKLVRRGALGRERRGARQVLRPTAAAARLLG